MSTRVLVVDDTVVFRRIVSDALAGAPGVEVVGTASNGRLAMARMAALEPDLVTLDIEMPEMNGIEVLEAMAAAGMKTGVIMLSSLTVRGGEMTVRALELGAFDFLTKPEGGNAEANLAHLRARLLPMIRAFERRREIRAILRGERSRSAPAAVPVPAPGRSPPSAGAGVAPYGSAAGADRRVHRRSRRVGQAGAGAAWRSGRTGIHRPAYAGHVHPGRWRTAWIRRAPSGSRKPRMARPPQANCAYLAPGGRQMKLAAGPKGEIILRITDDPPENGCRPAVDYLFRSAALHFPGRSVAAILTGMGNDGTDGLRMLKRSGCFSIAQDEASCVVFGMPKEAIQAGVVDSVAPLEMIGAAIVQSVREARA